MGEQQGDDDVDELVARVGDEVEELRGRGDGEEVGACLDDDDFGAHDGDGDGCCVAEELGVEGAAETGEQGGEQDVGDEGHGGDVHVGRVWVFARRQVEGCAGGGGVGRVTLLARPWLVPPGEEDDAQFGEDVRVGDVEVVLEGADGDVLADLGGRVSIGELSYLAGILCSWYMEGQGQRRHTFWSMYCCPALKAVWPICRPSWALGSLMKLPKAGCWPKPLPCCWGMPPPWEP